MRSKQKEPGKSEASRAGEKTSKAIPSSCPRPAVERRLNAARLKFPDTSYVDRYYARQVYKEQQRRARKARLEREVFTDEEAEAFEEGFSEFETDSDPQLQSESSEEERAADPDTEKFQYLRRVHFWYKALVLLELPWKDYVHVVVKSVAGHFFIGGMRKKYSNPLGFCGLYFRAFALAALARGAFPSVSPE